VGSNILLIIKHGVGRGMLTGVCKIDTAGLAGGAPGTDRPTKQTTVST
jgi:Na+/alanine symporter